MRFTRLLIGAFALLLLPLPVAAEYINVYPGPDENWNYLYDYGEVEVGKSGVMVFQIECDDESPGFLIVDNVFIADAGPFAVTDAPAFPAVFDVGESIYVEVTFTPGSEGLAEGIMKILSNASNVPPGANISYALQGTGVAYVPTPEERMDALIDYFDANSAPPAPTICGLGPGNSASAKLRIFGRMLDTAADLIALGAYAYPAACDELERAYLRSDGESPPKDYIDCEGGVIVNAMIAEVMDAIDCE